MRDVAMLDKPVKNQNLVIRALHRPFTLVGKNHCSPERQSCDSMKRRNVPLGIQAIG
jgi:hypothetical protein